MLLIVMTKSASLSNSSNRAVQHHENTHKSNYTLSHLGVIMIVSVCLSLIYRICICLSVSLHHSSLHFLGTYSDLY